MHARGKCTRRGLRQNCQLTDVFFPLFPLFPLVAKPRSKRKLLAGDKSYFCLLNRSFKLSWALAQGAGGIHKECFQDIRWNCTLNFPVIAGVGTAEKPHGKCLIAASLLTVNENIWQVFCSWTESRVWLVISIVLGSGLSTLVKGNRGKYRWKWRSVFLRKS